VKIDKFKQVTTDTPGLTQFE